MILHVSRHDSERQKLAFGVHQRHALAPDPHSGTIIAARPAHTDALDALRVDDRQSCIEPASAAPPSASQRPIRLWNSPFSNQRRNQLQTVRQRGKPAGSAFREELKQALNAKTG